MDAEKLLVLIDDYAMAHSRGDWVQVGELGLLIRDAVKDLAEKAQRGDATDGGAS